MPESAVFTARPSVVSFGSKNESSELYPAKMIDPFADNYCGTPKIQGAYKSENGDLVFNVGFSKWYILPEGSKEAYEIIQHNYDGGPDQFRAILSTDLSGEHKQELRVDQVAGTASFGDRKLSIVSEEEKAKLLAASVNEEISFVGLPDVRKIEHALQFPDGDYMIVSCSSPDYQYESLRIFKGPSLDALHEIKVNEVVRYRDGGTTYYLTEAGTLHSPVTFFSKEAPVTWTPKGSEEAIELKELDHKDISNKIGQSDTRICGIKPWHEYQQSQRTDGRSWSRASSANRGGWTLG